MAIRLINTETLQMKMFFGESVPEYAILSHTWVEGEEVDFQEMARYGGALDRGDSTNSEGVCTCACPCQSLISDIVRRRPGHEKIVRICRLARERNIDWAWVDTCCIDKSSSAELSEAINSMYRWYNRAKVCFVFLADLDLDPESDLASYSEPTELEEALGRCRWFTRGWTLQELIAPVAIEFYNRHWKKVGSHATLQSALAKASGIRNLTFGDGSFFRNRGARALQDVAVAERMSWASKRRTTRVEDVAYCLMGIFDINMPLLYGEGQKAFQRLQEEILKRSNDMSIFCSSSNYAKKLCWYGWDVLPVSPSAFDGSRDFWPPNPFMDKRWSQATFSVTNRGLLVQNAYLIPCSSIGFTKPYYILELNCTATVTNPRQCVMVLEWVAPSLYMRISDYRPLPRCVITGDGADGQMGLTEDFYILTFDAYMDIWKGDLEDYTEDTDWVELTSGTPPWQLHVAQAAPPQYWDVAARRFVGVGLRYAKVELANRTDGAGGAIMTASFHIVFHLDDRGESWVRLYSTDEWQGVKADFDRLSRSDSLSRLPGWSSFKVFKDGDDSDWLPIEARLGPYGEGGIVPARAQATIVQRETYNGRNLMQRAVSIELQWLREDGTYSSDFSGFTNDSSGNDGKDTGQVGGT
ncbi:hypothetical protein GGTG_05479 [Gaeumannomyces tritici R3-111a-1]|uniref:Heterokaryon incompatibility domain-containing protein n=1 Tax=Gaeumannomyces tritici (strain R3-111a-1) TaxID=644352 RepID=J3NW16_GAET3|nr:hypothetical protein GGTG_05479 [Gaeumannomyces tritici R3-111a-1]EJT75546.1 hypothetical protein GGTG_05479 [Gaeumannomyces tritici R3-111a-1]